MKAFTVQCYSLHKLGHTPFERETWMDREFDTREEADQYARTINGLGFGGDRNYRYVVAPNLPPDQPREPAPLPWSKPELVPQLEETPVRRFRF